MQLLAIPTWSSQCINFSRVALKSNSENNWKLYWSCGNAANFCLAKCQKGAILYKKISQRHQIDPKHARKTVHEILKKRQRHNIVNEINLPDKTVASTREMVSGFSDYFTDISPKLAEKIDWKQNCSFRDFIP